MEKALGKCFFARIFELAIARGITFSCYPNWDAIAPKGQTQLIEPIGSHNLGTKFINGNALKSSAIEARIHQWADQLPGFYYGRFDEIQRLGIPFNRERLYFNGN